MDKFNELYESVITEGKKPRKASFTGKRYDPDDMRKMIYRLFKQYLNGDLPMDDWGYLEKPYKFNDKKLWDDLGIEVDVRYSGAYQQDDNWKGYADVMIDSNRYEGKDITEFFKAIRADIKENNRWR